ncbi:MAG: hypothetical protein NT166_21010 [Candidatus Aminicenantes bacterium]|nr:hypothetical protein [Candidatus Aminicenantes bacterium]
MKKKISLYIFLVLFLSQSAMMADRLTTINRAEYEGKMEAYKFGTIYFNVYKFGKMYRTERFPADQVWKIEFNEPREKGLESSFEMEAIYKKLRRGKRVHKITINAATRWVDTGINIRIGQEILFSAEGSIYIDKQTQVFQDGQMPLNINAGKPLPNQPTGAIIARVGTRAEPFYVGADKAPFQMAQKGNLFLGINDFDFIDNSGSFDVTIYY